MTYPTKQREGISKDALVNIIKSSNGRIVINPLARWGKSRIWSVVKRARRAGLVHVRHEGPGRAVVTFLHQSMQHQSRSNINGVVR